MSRSPREVLLEEARDRHKLELARYTEAHTRIGVHLAILGAFSLALLRFVDKPPQGNALVMGIFVFGAVALCITTLVVFGLVLAVIWGFGTRYPAPMQAWVEQADKLRAFSKGSGGEERAAEDLEQDLLNNLCEAADHNAKNNDRRSNLIVYASRGLVAAAVAFVASGVTYLYLSIGKAVPAEVNITAPVRVQLDGMVQLQPVSLQPVQVQPVRVQGPVELQVPIQGNEHGRKTR